MSFNDSRQSGKKTFSSEQTTDDNSFIGKEQIYTNQRSKIMNSKRKLLF